MEKIQSFFIQYFNPDHLREGINLPLAYVYIGLGVFVLMIAGGFVLQLFISKRTLPKFYKRFVRWIGDFLIYIPLIFILFLGIYLAGFTVYNYFFVFAFVIWLIWFVFLVYYRIVKVSGLWYKYREQKRKEKYKKNA